jgi:peptidoglycan-N-acetylglucosamine deacetylase
MKRAILAGGAIAAISVISAGAYGVVQTGWFGGLPQGQPPLAVAARAPAPAPAPKVVSAPATPAPMASVVATLPPTPVTVAQAPAAAAPRPTAPPAPASPAPVSAAPVPASAAPAPPPPASPALASPAPVPAPIRQAAATPASPPATPAAAPPPAGSTADFPPLGPSTPPKPIACANPNAMGIVRTVEIDTTGGPGFGSQHFKSYDFLRDHEVVLTFDDGPWLGHTQAVLKALADQCLHATFFSIGKHATYYPEILKQVIAAGHTVGSHTWSHADLQAVIKKSGFDAAKEEIEKGASAVHMMAGAPIAPFFRFPDLRHPPELLTYLGERNIGTFSTDIDSWDFKIKKPDELVKSLMGKLQKQGKGILLMHDFQKVTSIALPQILGQLQKNGYKVVHMVPKGTLTTLPQYDEAVLKENKLQTLTNRPADSVVRTISGE